MNLQGDDPRTLIMLHGTGGTAEDFARLGAMIAPEAAVLSLAGNVDENGMARFFRRTGEGVYDMDDLARRTHELDAFLEAVLAKHGRDPAKAIGIGYSNGANILANLLFTNPARLGAYALMHPLIPFTPAPNAALAESQVLITAGAHDPICPPALTDGLIDWLQSQGSTVEQLVHRGGHELRQEEIDRLAVWIAKPEA
ncbi:alpha/beta hydrolase [Breoghania sp. L-A4]|nr:alpha/beta hydrolase [Breoghania sp. L-A4]